MATLIHFDIPAEDTERAKEFYSKIFGWKFNLLPGPSPYYLIETHTLNGEKGIGGGMSKRPEDAGGKGGIIIYCQVTSIDESCREIVSEGGKIIQSKQALPGWGYLAVCSDTENNSFGIFQEAPSSR